MFRYTVKHTESEYDIQNNDLLYKIDQQYQNTFDFLILYLGRLVSVGPLLVDKQKVNCHVISLMMLFVQ